jgi:hypothetical protein
MVEGERLGKPEVVVAHSHSKPQMNGSLRQGSAAKP